MGTYYPNSSKLASGRRRARRQPAFGCFLHGEDRVGGSDAVQKDVLPSVGFGLRQLGLTIRCRSRWMVRNVGQH